MKDYKYDLHVHTSEVSSCAKVEAKDMIHMYKEAGYQGVVVTDHYMECYFKKLGDKSWDEKIEEFLAGYRKAFKEGKRIGIDVLFGIELKFTENDNDYLIYGLDEEFLKQNKELYNLNLDKVVNLIKDKDIVIFQAHPFRKSCSCDKEKAKLLDGIEVYNGNPRHDSKNKDAYKFAKDNNLLMVSGSDFHEREDLGTGGIITNTRITNDKELVKELKNIIEDKLINLPL